MTQYLSGAALAQPLVAGEGVTISDLWRPMAGSSDTATIVTTIKAKTKQLSSDQDQKANTICLQS